MRFENRYGRLDRILHRIAFSTRIAQLGAAELEERLFRAELDAVEAAAPVFVTSLPRAGTTILLDVLAELPEFATHVYRDMPFVLCPMLWRRMSPTRRTEELRERAHGDGIEITLDSPEAFEEMVWMAHWRRHYGRDRIRPWQRCDDEDFLGFFSDHRRKIIALRRRDKPTAARYASKNNANVARIPALLSAIADATIIVPVRDPIQQAHSLLRQHRRFAEMHAEDGFARRYMRGIGHFDFGANLRPIDFGGWLDGRAHRDPQGIAFWLEYWVACYRHLAAHAAHPRLHFIEFESLGQESAADALASAVGVAAAELRRRSGRLRPPPPRDVDTSGVPGFLREAARAIHAGLTDLARAS